MMPDLIPLITYKASTIPGVKEGISGSCICSFNLGINKYIDKENLISTIEAFKFLTSKELQKKLLKKNYTISSISSLYDDEEVCEVIDCELYKSIQYIGIPKDVGMRYDEYSEKLESYLYDFLYGNATAKDSLKKINDITKIYKISVDTKDSVIGLISLILISLISVIMLLSSLFLFKENYKPFFEYLSFDFWIITILGSIIILYSCYTEYGDLTVVKCHLKYLFLSLGLTLNLVPTLSKLIINFPEENKLSNWINNYSRTFLLIFIMIDIIMNGLAYVFPFDVESNLIDGGENYLYCNMKNIFGIIMIYVVVIYKISVMALMLFLLFVEWNIQKYISDVRIIISTIYIDLLTIIIYIIFVYCHIKNYIINYLIKECIIFIISISNYVFLYGFRLIFAFLNKKNLKQLFINNINKKFINNESSTNNSILKTAEICVTNQSSYSEESSNDTSKAPFKTSIFTKIINYHNSTSAYYDNNNYFNSSNNNSTNN